MLGGDLVSGPVLLAIVLVVGFGRLRSAERNLARS
jgi:hypothetical protein